MVEEDVDGVRLGAEREDGEAPGASSIASPSGTCTAIISVTPSGQRSRGGRQSAPGRSSATFTRSTSPAGSGGVFGPTRRTGSLGEPVDCGATLTPRIALFDSGGGALLLAHAAHARSRNGVVTRFTAA